MTLTMRIASSGSRPYPAPMLSIRCLGLLVAGIAQVTAGCEMTYLRKNCAHDLQSNSAAHDGSFFPRTRENSPAAANGRLTITAVPESSASGSKRRSASRSAIE